MDRLAAQLKAHGGFSSLLAFKPTGWAFSPGRGGGGGGGGGAAHAKGGRDCPGGNQRQLELPGAVRSGVADAAGGGAAKGCVDGAVPDAGMGADVEAVEAAGDGALPAHGGQVSRGHGPLRSRAPMASTTSGYSESVQLLDSSTHNHRPVWLMLKPRPVRWG